MRICFSCMDDMFKNRDYIYMITIKPPPDEQIHDRIYNVCDYFDKKNIKYWIVKCKSDNAYIHFHGLISFPESQTPNKGLISCVQRKINRDMGFMRCLPIATSKREVYEYIRGARNTNGNEYIQTDYFKYVPDHRCFFM